MLLTLIICHLSVFVAANPFHKYPFVFLLDVGNEELEKTNSEQIRVSVPGGSIALRYPAIGDGDTIGHVRVSGIDFGTDLKANIVDGGPGYKYVVLVFIGNPGTTYDAVVTLQTVSDKAFNTPGISNLNGNSVTNAYQNEEDLNNSAEDLSDAEANNDVHSKTHIENSNAELMQSSSNVYGYADGLSINENENNDDEAEDDDSNDKVSDSEVASNELYSDELASEESDKADIEDNSNEKDIHKQYIDDIVHDDPDDQVKDFDENEEDDDDEESNIKVGEYSSDDYSEAKPVVINNNLYSKYKSVKDHSSFGQEVYSQEELQGNTRPSYQEDPLDYIDPYSEPMYDEGPNYEVDKYRDSNNNNYIDSDDSYAVAY